MNRSERSEVWKTRVSLPSPLISVLRLGEMETDPLFQDVIRIA